MASLQTRITAHFRTINSWKGFYNSDAVHDLAKFFEQNPFPADVKQSYLLKHCVLIAVYCLKSGPLEHNVVGLALDYCREFLRRAETGDDASVRTAAVFNAAAGDFLRYLAKTTPHDDVKAERFRSAYDFFSKSIEIFEACRDPVSAGYKLANRGDIAHYLSSLDHDAERWLLLAADDKAHSAGLLESVNPRHAAYQHVFAAEYKFKASQLVANSRLQRELAVEAIEQGVKALEAFPGDYRLFFSLGFYCENLFALTGDKASYVRACNYYKQSLRNRDPSMRLSARRRLKNLKKLYKMDG